MNIPDAMHELGLLLKQPGLTLSDAGTCRLSFDDLVVDFEKVAESNTLQLRSVVSLLGLEDEESLESLLRANLLGSATQGGVFSMSPDGEILFERWLDMEELNLSAFTGEVESYLNYLRHWEARLAGVVAD